MGGGETFTNYLIFQPDDDTLSNSARYGSVSHTALNHGASFYSQRASYSTRHLVNNHNGYHRTATSYNNIMRWSPRTGHCPCSSETGLTAWSAGRTCLRQLRIILYTAWRKLVTMERKKLYSLIGMVVQSSLVALCTRYSRVEQEKGKRYLPSSAVVISEVIKVILCLLVIAFTARKTLLSQLSTLTNSRDVIKSCVPAILYTVQNNLLYVAMTYLDAATFQVTYQLKILTTAIFSVCFLQKRLDGIHWSALILLTGGVALVQFPTSIDCTAENNDGSCTARESEHLQEVMMGVTAVLAMCLSSGFTGVYVEKILKSTTSTQNLWIRNLQLAVTSVIIGFLYLCLYDGKTLMSSGLLANFDFMTWIVVFQQAFLGLLISLVMKYADNILKGFASSIGIVFTTFVSSVFLHDLTLSCSYLMGSVIVMGSALMYSTDRSVDLRKSEQTV